MPMMKSRPADLCLNNCIGISGILATKASIVMKTKTRKSPIVSVAMVKGLSHAQRLPPELMGICTD
jgi:hypothetical protein